VKYWDASAIVPLLVEEPATSAIQAAYGEDSTIITAWTTAIECGSAVARAEREGALTLDQTTVAFARLDDLVSTWLEVEPGTDLRAVARRLLRSHPLRAADAIQLASATVATGHRTTSLAVVTLDTRLGAVAMKEGFPVLVPGRSP
jgi:hypothetical protein